MKIIGVLTSPKKVSNTGVLLKETLNGAKEAGAEIELIKLSDFTITSCKGCLNCITVGSCPLEDDFEIIREKLYQTDGIVFGTPTYMNGYNAELRKFFERYGLFEHMTSKYFGNRYFACVTTALGNTGDTIKSLSGQTGIFARKYYSGGYGLSLKGRNVHEYNDALTACNQLGWKMVDDINKKRKYRLQNLSARIINTIFIKPSYLKMIEKAKGHYKAVYNYLDNKGII